MNKLILLPLYRYIVDAEYERLSADVSYTVCRGGQEEHIKIGRQYDIEDNFPAIEIICYHSKEDSLSFTYISDHFYINSDCMEHGGGRSIKLYEASTIDSYTKRSIDINFMWDYKKTYSEEDYLNKHLRRNYMDLRREKDE